MDKMFKESPDVSAKILNEDYTASNKDYTASNEALVAVLKDVGIRVTPMCTNSSLSEYKLLRNFQLFSALITNEKAFRHAFGFTIDEYIKNRREFAEKCLQYAAHTEEIGCHAGIARTVGGGVTVASGGLALLGVILSPFTVGASLGLTIAGITGGIVGSGASVGAMVTKELNIRSNQKKINEAFEELTQQHEVKEEVVFGVLKKLDKDVQSIKEQIDSGKLTNSGNTNLEAMILMSGLGTVKNVVSLATEIQSVVKLTSTIAMVVDDVAVISTETAASTAATAGRAAATAGSITLKVFSGIAPGVGMGFGAFDMYQGVKDIKGSDKAADFRKFADKYDEETAKIEKAFQQYFERSKREGKEITS